jgi:arabinogalactan endo-1,4-beta-galactosidase
VVSLVVAAVMASGSSAVPYWRGVDASFLPQYADLKATFFAAGKPTEPLAAMAKAGANLLRLRIWVNPTDGYCSVKKSLPLARTAKQLGMKLLVDFHYSDTWADPGHQIKPKAWNTFTVDQLAGAVTQHTREVTRAFIAQGTPPAMVAVGNEVRDGMMWPEGQISKGGYANFVRFLKAGITGVNAAFGADTPCPIMIHNDAGGDAAGCKKWYGNLKKDGVKFDVIGVSYYPWWHGSLDAVKENLNGLAETFSVPVMVVETAYPFTLGYADNSNNFVGEEKQLLPGYPATTEGQSAFLTEVHRIVRDVPNGRGIGVCYWAPEYVAWPTIETPYENLTLFDFKRNLLPGARALGEKKP